MLQSPYSLSGTGGTSLTPLRQSYQSFTRTVSFVSLSGSRREIAARGGGIGSLLFLYSFHVVFDPFVPLINIIISAPALTLSARSVRVGLRSWFPFNYSPHTRIWSFISSLIISIRSCILTQGSFIHSSLAVTTLRFGIRATGSVTTISSQGHDITGGLVTLVTVASGRLFMGILYLYYFCIILWSRSTTDVILVMFFRFPPTRKPGFITDGWI